MVDVLALSNGAVTRVLSPQNAVLSTKAPVLALSNGAVTHVLSPQSAVLSTKATVLALSNGTVTHVLSTICSTSKSLLCHLFFSLGQEGSFWLYLL